MRLSGLLMMGTVGRSRTSHHQGGGEDAIDAGSEFYPHLASCTTFMPSICSCRKPEPSTSWIVAPPVDFARLYVLHQAGAFFVTRAKSNIDAHRVYSAPTDSTGIICDQTISLDGFSYTRPGLPRTSAAHASRIESGKTLVFIAGHQQPGGGTLIKANLPVTGLPLVIVASRSWTPDVTNPLRAHTSSGTDATLRK